MDKKNLLKELERLLQYYNDLDEFFEFYICEELTLDDFNVTNCSNCIFPISTNSDDNCEVYNIYDKALDNKEYVIEVFTNLKNEISLIDKEQIDIDIVRNIVHECFRT